MGKNGRSYAEKFFTWDKTVKETLFVYKSVIEDS